MEFGPTAWHSALLFLIAAFSARCLLLSMSSSESNERPALRYPIVSRRAVFLVCGLVSLTMGCGDRAPASSAGRASDANPREVLNAGGPRWTAATAWRLEEDLRLGSTGGDSADAVEFGQIMAIAVDSRGAIYVLDWLSQEIRVFDRSGSFTHRIGRRGMGPGEFAGARSLSFGPGDTLWVLDDGATRYSAFSTDGTFLKSHRRKTIGYSPSSPSLALDDGSYLDWRLASPDGRMGARIQFHPVRLHADFEHADSLPPLEHQWPMLPSGGMPETHFSGSMVVGMERTGIIWFAHSQAYRIYRRTLQGDTTLVFGLPATAAALGETERALIRREYEHLPAVLSEYLEALPATKPVVHRILPDNAGHVLVFPDVAGVPAGGVMDVFQESGVYLGRLTMPEPLPLGKSRIAPVVHIRDDHLYTVLLDSDDTPYISRLKIIKSP